MKLPLILLTCISGFLPSARAQEVSAAAATLILVRGASGSPEFGETFDRQTEAWRNAAAEAGAELVTVGGGAAEAEGPTDKARLEKILTDLPPEGPAALWLVLVGHGTWDGKEARFNLEGPDLAATDLATWLSPVRRPVIVINTASSSAPFLPALAAPNRIIITATRSGNEKNFARFGEFLAASLGDKAADFDQDGQLSLLEWFLNAAGRTSEFYLAESRIRTEHALIDDNGDGKGTPGDWFRGLRAVRKAKGDFALDGARAGQQFLSPDTATRRMTAAQLTAREELEGELETLRRKKSDLPEEAYYGQLEALLLRIAALYEAPEQ